MPESDSPADIAAAYLRYMDRFSSGLGWPPDPGAIPSADVDEWAADRLNVWALMDAENLWPVILELVAQATSLDQLGYIAAGPVEDLLVQTGDQFVDAFRERAEVDARWAFAVACTYPDRMSESGRHLVEYWRDPARSERVPEEARAALIKKPRWTPARGLHVPNTPEPWSMAMTWGVP